MTLFSPLKEGVDTSYVIKPDYGSLEERLAKRQNLPLELDGDHDRDRHTVGEDCDGGADRDHVEALTVQPAHIEQNQDALTHQAIDRILGWVNADPGRRLGGGGGGGEGGGDGGPAAGPAVIPDGHMLLGDMSFEAHLEKGGTAAARVVAFCPEPGSELAGRSGDGRTQVTVRAFAKDLASGKMQRMTMHWAAGVQSASEWGRPSDDMLPVNSERYKDAVQTVMQAAQSGEGEAEGWGAWQGIVQEVRMQLPPLVQAVNFVIKNNDNWYKADGGNDFQIRLPGTSGPSHSLTGYTDVGSLSMKYDAISSFEGRGGLALMERFQEAKSFLEGVAPDDPEALTAVFVWLRYSQVRQVAWQRKHNTKPRELGWAIEDLSKTVAWRWRQADGTRRELLRQLLSTVPRGGGDGQAIRDYILVIMRKFEIKKRKGTFMEEWHQKLHNNSTPDDIIICEAYLEFLRTHGDLNAFYAHLLRHGIDRKRLQTYDRPILQDPHYFPTIRNGLSNELRKYLKILKSVHAGADLRRLLGTCKHSIGDHLCSLAAASLSVHGHEQALGALSRAVEARHGIAENMVKEGDGTKVRDLLYLDLALESQSRLIIENALSHVSGGQLPAWLALAAESLLISLRYASGAGGRSQHRSDGEEVEADAWEGFDAAMGKAYEELREALADFMVLLQKHGADTAQWGGGDKWGALWGAACVERVQRALGSLVDRQQSLLQPVAEMIGNSIRQRTPDKKPERWSITMFTEEVVRGSMSFAVSALMRKLEAEIRAAGGLSSWQIVSPGLKAAAGVLRPVVLKDVQEVSYSEPTVLLASKITGEEEIPPGVTAIITPDAVDVLSHVSVRARQLKVLFASCFDEGALASVMELSNHAVRCSMTGDVLDVAAASSTDAQGGGGGPAAAAGGMGAAAAAGGAEGGGQMDLKVSKGEASRYCIHEEELVGGHAAEAGAKTTNLVALRKLLPPNIHTPASAVIPFGALVKTLNDNANREIKARYEAAVAAATKGDLVRIGSTLTGLLSASRAVA
jgi:alpha-glucan,water dikinase